jgi:spore germination cell wall hydrolase CwlJ-like protein
LVFPHRRFVFALVASAAAIPTLAASAPAQQLIAPAIAHTPDSPSTQTAPTPSVETATLSTPSDDSVTAAPQATDAEMRPAVAPAEQSAAIECIAKVVRHEAANQSARGQLAVAQLIINRTRAGSRFGHTPCAVVNQPGQFFNTDSYNPDRRSGAWTRAVEVSRDAVQHLSPEVTPGALFYHAAYQAPPRFFRSRQRVAVLGDHIFYR